MTSREKLALLRRGYEAFNGRDIEAALAGMDRDVEWPNVLEGITIRGHDAVRDYWTKQFRLTESRVVPEQFIEAGERIVVVVHQVVRDPQGTLLADQRVAHVYTFSHSKIARMDVYADPGKALEAVGLSEQDAHAD